jgi:hypothetical protein
MSDAFAPDLGEAERLPPAPGQYGAQKPQQPKPEGYIPSVRNRPYSQWGEPDFAMQGAQGYPGMSPGPMMPQASDYPALIHGITMGLGRWGSRYVGMPAIAMGTYATAFLNAYNQGMKERAAQNYQQYRQAREMMIDRQEEETRAYKDVYSAFHDEEGKVTDPDAFSRGIMAVAVKYHDDPILNAIRAGKLDMVDRILQGRDGHLNDARKMKQQEDAKKLDDELKRLEIERKKQDVERQRQEEEESKKFISGQQGTTPTTTGAGTQPTTPQAGPTLRPSGSDALDSAAQAAQMGEKINIPKTAAAEAAVNKRKAELDKYMRDLTDPKSTVPPEQILDKVREANPRMADEVDNLINGNSRPTDTESVKEPFSTAIRLAKKIDPNYQRNAELRKEQEKQKLQMAQASAVRNDLSRQKIQYSTIAETIGKNTKDMEYLLELANNKTLNGKETGSPVIDRWIRAGRQNVLGDPEVTRFNIQFRLFQSDVGQIITRAGGTTGVYTVYGQREMQDVLSPGMNKGQLEAAIGAFRRDYANRMLPIIDQINTLNAELANIYGRPDMIPPPLDASKDPLLTGLATTQAPPKPGDIIDGWRFKGGDPGNKKNWEKQ